MAEPQFEYKTGRIATVAFVFFAIVVGGGWFFMNRANLNIGSKLKALTGNSSDSQAQDRASDQAQASQDNRGSSNVAATQNSGPVPVAKASTTAQTGNSFRPQKKPIDVCVVVWGGYIGGQYFNRGFAPDNPESMYMKRYGLPVRFSTVPSPDRSRELWKSRKGCDLLWVTADSFSAETGGLVRDFNPKFLFQSDYSRGGDVWVGAPGLDNICKLRGRSVAAAKLSPSHTFLFFGLGLCSMSPADVILKLTDTPEQARDMVISGEADSGVMWSPFELDVQRDRPGSVVITDTRKADHIIADGFIAHAEFVQERRQDVVNLVTGWLEGAAEVNTNPKARQEAEAILVRDQNVPPGDATAMIDNVRLSTLGDNLEFLELVKKPNIVTGRKLYTDTGRLYTKYHNDLVEPPADWRQIVDTSIVAEIQQSGVLSGPENDAEGTVRFKPVALAAVASAPSISEKTLSVTYETGSAVLTQDAKNLIDTRIAPDAGYFGTLRIEVVGHTDNTGSSSTNDRLSLERALSVKNYLVQKGFDLNRFAVDGRGSSEPVNPNVDNNLPENRAKNRRTVFKYKVVKGDS